MSAFRPFGPWTPPKEKNLPLPDLSTLHIGSTVVRQPSTPDLVDLDVWNQELDSQPEVSDNKPTAERDDLLSRLFSLTPLSECQPLKAAVSPLLPTDNVWGPPSSCSLPKSQKHHDLETIRRMLELTEEKMKRLEAENERLKVKGSASRESLPVQTTLPLAYSQSMTPPSPPGYHNFASSIYLPGYGTGLNFAGTGFGYGQEIGRTPVPLPVHNREYPGYGYDRVPGLDSREFSRGHFADTNWTLNDISAISDPGLPREMSYNVVGPETNVGDYSAPSTLVSAVLGGTFLYGDMPSSYIRPLIWIIAHVQTRVPSENNGLKTAVTALATRMGLSQSFPGTQILIDSILEWAKQLCYTASGNYLCQQLLEKGSSSEKKAFIDKIRDDIVPIASDKFGTHVLCKAIAIKELEETVANALISFGIYESMITGARRLWREYLERCRQFKSLAIFQRINDDLKGRWVELATSNEHGTISAQQVFEVFGSQELMDPCFKEIMEDISNIANNQYGHYLISKLIAYPQRHRATCDAILSAYPPVATTHHGVNFIKIALMDGGRNSIMRYVDAICNHEEGRTPGIVAIATSSIGRGHLNFVLGSLSPSEQGRIRQTCRAFSTTLRNSQSGNDLLRALGLINAVATRRVMSPITSYHNNNLNNTYGPGYGGSSGYGARQYGNQTAGTVSPVRLKENPRGRAEEDTDVDPKP